MAAPELMPYGERGNADWCQIQMKMGQAGRLTSPALKALGVSAVVYIVPINYADFGSRFWCSVLASPKLDDTFTGVVWFSYLVWTLVAQGLLAAALYPLFRRVNRFFLVPIMAIPLIIVTGFPFSVGAVWLDSRAVPFIYRGHEGPPIDWQEACRVEHAHLLAPAQPRYEFLERSARGWLVSHATWEPMMLMPEGCRTVAYTATEAGQTELRGIFKREPPFDVSWNDGGFRHSLFDRRVPSTLGTIWSPEHGYQFTPTSLMFQRQYLPGGCVIFGFNPDGHREVPAESDVGCPALSGDSELLGSLERTTYSITERRVEIAPAHGPGPTGVDISKVGSGFVSLEGVSVNRRSVLIRRQSSMLLHARTPDLEARGFSHEYSEIGFDGHVVWRLPRVGGADDARLAVDGENWVWWQTESRRPLDCCRLEWRRDGTAGRHRVARGRSIVSVSLCPTGKLIAVSVSGRHWTGTVSDSVYVIRTVDGSEVFRRYLQPMAQSRVQFLGPELLAYTDFDGSDGFVRVVRVPANLGSIK